MKISCEEAGHICTKAQYKEASPWEIFKLKFHSLFCKVCSKYSRKNTQLTNLCEKANLQSLDNDTKERMKKALEEKL